MTRIAMTAEMKKFSSRFPARSLRTKTQWPRINLKALRKNLMKLGTCEGWVIHLEAVTKLVNDQVSGGCPRSWTLILSPDEPASVSTPDANA
jgi:hypothetical protein